MKNYFEECKVIVYGKYREYKIEKQQYNFCLIVF